MKSLLSGVLLVVLLCPGAIDAQIVSFDNAVGLFFDEQAEIPHIWQPAYTVGQVYLILINPTATEGIVGWACDIQIEGCIEILDWRPRGETVANLLAPPEFYIGIGPPLPVQPVVVLMSIDYLILCNECIWYELFGVEGSGPVYADSAFPNTMIPMIPIQFGDPPLINCGIVSSETGTWARVKAMYE